jgi:GntR family transcriptional regulator
VVVSDRLRGLDPSKLNRSSFVPLYYQLQELLKEQIESGIWTPGELLPSEPQLARRAAGLSRLLVAPREPDVQIQVLDKRVAAVEKSIRRSLDAGEDPVLRITTLLSVRGVAIAIGYSFFRAEEVRWLDEATHVGRPIAPGLVLGERGVELTRSAVSIETSQCGRFEAAHFGVPPRSAVFLVLCHEFRRATNGERPFEVARIEYRGDVLQFRLELGSGAADTGLEATFALSERGNGRA